MVKIFKTESLTECQTIMKDNLDDLIDWASKDNALVLVYKENEEELGYDNGLCKYCVRWFDNWFYRHTIFCNKNPNPDLNLIEKLKQDDKIRLSREGKCSVCDKKIKYFSFNKHKKSKKNNCDDAIFIE